jgi:hypothetical protein
MFSISEPEDDTSPPAAQPSRDVALVLLFLLATAAIGVAVWWSQTDRGQGSGTVENVEAR